MQFPTSYVVSIHTKDTTRTAKIEKILPSVFYECQKREIPVDKDSQFLHNVSSLRRCPIDSEWQIEWISKESLHVMYERGDKASEPNFRAMTDSGSKNSTTSFAWNRFFLKNQRIQKTCFRVWAKWRIRNWRKQRMMRKYYQQNRKRSMMKRMEWNAVLFLYLYPCLINWSPELNQ